MANPILERPRATRGKTVGRAMIKSFIHDYLHGQEPGFKPLYTQGRFNTMVEGLSSEREYTIYLQYVALYNGLSEELVRSQAYAQQAQHGLTHLQALLADVRRAEDLSGLLERFTALYGQQLDRDAAGALSARMGGLFISLDTLARDRALFDLARGYHDALLCPALFGLSAYDTLVDLLIEALDFPDLSALHARTEDLARDLSAYAREIDETPALLRGDKKAILRKRETLSALFRPERLEGHAPPPDAIETVRTFLQNTENYQNGFLQQLFIQLLGGIT